MGVAAYMHGQRLPSLQLRDWTPSFESIVVYTWGPQKQCCRDEFVLEGRLEKLRVASFEGQRACSDQTIAELLSLTVDQAERERCAAEISAEIR